MEPRLLETFSNGPKLTACFTLTPRGVERITLTQNPQETGLSLSVQGPASEDQSNIDSIMIWVDHYLNRRHAPFDLPLLLPPFSPFVLAALEALQELSFGECLSYSSLASRMGNPRAARAVGNACTKNPFPLVIPCHRVVRADGHLGGFEAGPSIKEQLLAFEAPLP